MQGLAGLLPFILLFAIMYFMMIRPQQKRDKQLKLMLSQLVKGDKILTIGGIIGKITSIKDDELLIETGRGSDKSFMSIRRNAVSEVLKAAPSQDDNYDEFTEAE